MVSSQVTAGSGDHHALALAASAEQFLGRQ